MRVCVDVPGLNRAVSQRRLWPSAVGRYEGPPHSYVRMPFGLPSAVAARQRLLRSILETQEVRHHAVLVEVAMVPEDLHAPPEPPEAPGPGGS